MSFCMVSGHTAAVKMRFEKIAFGCVSCWYFALRTSQKQTVTGIHDLLSPSVGSRDKKNLFLKISFGHKIMMRTSWKFSKYTGKSRGRDLSISGIYFVIPEHQTLLSYPQSRGVFNNFIFHTKTTPTNVSVLTAH